MKKIYIGNIPFTTTRQELQDLFATYGQVEEVYLVRDPATRRTKGYGFVVFEHAEEAQAALALDGETYNGRHLRVSIAKDKDGATPAESLAADSVGVQTAKSPRILALLILTAIVSIGLSYFLMLKHDSTLVNDEAANIVALQSDQAQMATKIKQLDKEMLALTHPGKPATHA